MSPEYWRARALLLKTHPEGGTCYVCGHDGARTIEHLTPACCGGGDDPSNLGFSHGSNPGHRCPVCVSTGEHAAGACNQWRGGQHRRQHHADGPPRPARTPARALDTRTGRPQSREW